MSIAKIILAVAISVASVFSTSAAGSPGLITLKSGETIEAPEVWFTHGQAIYLMSSKDKKVVIEDPEIAYVQFYDEEKKDYGPKEYSEYVINSYEFLKKNPKMPKTKKSGGWKVFDIDGYILYMIGYMRVYKNGSSYPDVNFYFKKPEWPWTVSINYPLSHMKDKDCQKFYEKMFEDNPTMYKKLKEDPLGFAKSYGNVNDVLLIYPAMFMDYVETLDKK